MSIPIISGVTPLPCPGPHPAQRPAELPAAGPLPGGQVPAAGPALAGLLLAAGRHLPQDDGVQLAAARRGRRHGDSHLPLPPRHKPRHREGAGVELL